MHGQTKAAGIAARDFLQAKLPTKPTAMKLYGREKYGRCLGEFFDLDGKSINQQLIDAGHALSYSGKGPRP